MGEKEEKLALMDRAAVVAGEDFVERLEALEPQGLPGVTMVVEWMIANYHLVGYKRLAKFLVQEVNQSIIRGKQP